MEKIKKLFEPKQKDSSKKQSRPLTKKEKLMGILLILGVIIYATYNYAYLPQIEQITELETIKQEKTSQVDNMKKIIAEEFTIDAKIEEIAKNKEEAVSRYFTEIYQPSIIKMLSELMTVEGFNLDEVSFNDKTTEKIDKETPIYSMGITAKFTGNYEGISKVIENINNNYKHIGIVAMDLSKSEELLGGNFGLQILSTTGLIESEPGEYDITSITPLDGIKPFQELEGYNTKKEEELGEIDGELQNGNTDEKLDGEPEKPRDTRIFTLLEDFESDNYKFYNTSKLAKGRVSRSNNSKLNKYSLKIDYNIIAVEKINRVYADLTERDIWIKYPPQSLGMWVNSFGYSPATLGLRLTGQGGEIVDMEVTKGIGFMGWERLEVTPPQDVSIYPLQVEKIYIEMPQEREDFGVLLIDQLESIMPGKSTEEDDKIKTVKSYVFYIANETDTLRTIATYKYNNTKYLKEIGIVNDIPNYDEQITPGTIIILPKY